MTTRDRLLAAAIVVGVLVTVLLLLDAPAWACVGFGWLAWQSSLNTVNLAYMRARR